MQQNQAQTGERQSSSNRGNRTTQEVGVAKITINSPITNAWANAVSTQDHIIRKMHEKSMIEIPFKKVIYWQKKFHEALIAIDALNEAAAQDLGLEQIYKRSALINAIKSNLEAEEAANAT
jgi:hypothetical protein